MKREREDDNTDEGPCKEARLSLMDLEPWCTREWFVAHVVLVMDPATRWVARLTSKRWHEWSAPWHGSAVEIKEAVYGLALLSYFKPMHQTLPLHGLPSFETCLAIHNRDPAVDLLPLFNAALDLGATDVDEAYAHIVNIFDASSRPWDVLVHALMDRGLDMPNDRKIWAAMVRGAVRNFAGPDTISRPVLQYLATTAVRERDSFPIGFLLLSGIVTGKRWYLTFLVATVTATDVAHDPTTYLRDMFNEFSLDERKAIGIKLTTSDVLALIHLIASHGLPLTNLFVKEKEGRILSTIGRHITRPLTLNDVHLYFIDGPMLGGEAWTRCCALIQHFVPDFTPGPMPEMVQEEKVLAALRTRLVETLERMY